MNSPNYRKVTKLSIPFAKEMVIHPLFTSRRVCRFITLNERN